MRSTDYKLGYCTNVHAGANLAEVKTSLKLHAQLVKRSFSPNTVMGIGLWFSNEAAQQLIGSQRVLEFGMWLRDLGLDPYTFNAFPFSDFHQLSVKHNVYQPTWADESRLQYTLAMAKIQSRLLDPNSYGTISTLPLGWPSPGLNEEFQRKCAQQLIRCAIDLAELKHVTGQHVRVCIEPEPGCIINNSVTLVEFFERYLLAGPESVNELVRQHLGVCHDICHSAVLFESQKSAFDNYRSAGINVGKIQVSSAVEAVFDDLPAAEKGTVVKLLEQFGEDRYLHQTTIQDESGSSFYEDLTLALQQHRRRPRGVWRVHFHVPIFASQLAMLNTTQSEIHECLKHLDQRGGQPLHFEIETYAWSVIPIPWRPKSLAEGIAKELIWFREQCLMTRV